jgi:O-antigen ligase/tetratricopeptide (TPR) repeat protein
MNKAIRWVTLGALFLIPLLPFVVANGYFFPYITGKNFDFRILVEVAFAGWVLMALAATKYRPQFSWVLVLFIAFTAWMAVADALGMNPAKAFWSDYERMDGWITLIHLLMLFVVMGSIFTVDKLWRAWWMTFLAVSALICGYSFLQVAHVFAIHQGGVRLDATFGNSIYLACYMLFAIAVSVWQAFEAKQTWLRVLLGILTVAEIVVLFLTATRGAILGFAAAVLFGALLWMFESGQKGRRAAGAVLVVFLVLVGGFYVSRHQSWVTSDPTLSRIASISLSDPETHARITIWHMALEGFMQKPVLGWGQEGFNYVFNTYYEPSLNGQEPWFDRAHNMYLDWLLAGGFPALLLYLGLFVSAALALYKSTVSRPERVLFLSALAAYAFQGFFVFDNLFSYIPFVVILAMAHSAGSRPIEKFEKASVLDRATLATLALPLVLVILAVVLWVVNVPNIAAAQDLITAVSPSSGAAQTIANFKKAYADGSFANQEITEQLLSTTASAITSSGVPTADKQLLFTYAAQQGQSLVTAIPHDARIRLEYASLFRAGGDYADALKQIEVALQQSPRKQSILTEKGINEWQLGTTKAAQQSFMQAYQLDTSFSDIAAYAAAGDIITGDLAGARTILLKSEGTTTVSDDVVMLAYYQVKDVPDLLAAWQARVVRMHNSADAEFGYAEALATNGQVPAAKAEIQKAITDHPEAAAQGSQILTQINAIHP